MKGFLSNAAKSAARRVTKLFTGTKSITPAESIAPDALPATTTPVVRRTAVIPRQVLPPSEYAKRKAAKKQQKHSRKLNRK